MKKRYAVLGLASILAIAFAVPALGGPSNPIAHSAVSVGKAFKKAKKGIRLARNAQNSADNAQNSANGAQSSANGAQTTADAANTAAAAAQSSADAANANANTRLKTAVFRVQTVASSNVADKTALASCNSGEVTLGGGFDVEGTGSNQVTVEQSTPGLYGGWFAEAEAITGAPTWSFASFASCGQK